MMTLAERICDNNGDDDIAYINESVYNDDDDAVDDYNDHENDDDDVEDDDGDDFAQADDIKSDAWSLASSSALFPLRASFSHRTEL